MTIGHVATLVRWEGYKLACHRMPWVLLVFLVLFSQLAVWGGYVRYNMLQASGAQVPLRSAEGGRGGRFSTVSCNQLRADPEGTLPAGTTAETTQELLRLCDEQAGRWDAQLRESSGAFTLPASLSGAYGVAHTVGLILIAVLTASAIGLDHGLGTLRAMLARGTGRSPLLIGKFLLLASVAAAALLIVGLVTIASSMIAGSLAELPAGGVPAASWTDAAIDASKTWLSFLPFVAFTAAVTVLTQSTAAGMAIALGYSFTEGLLITLLSAIFEWFEPVADYLLMRNINAFAGGGFGPGGGNSDITQSHAAIVLATYAVVLGGVAILRFRWRDVAGAAGR
jgi:ABC-type transport system involved in multi-copper enzyme maturation permease subunit